MIKVNITKTKTEEVEIDDYNATKVALSVLSKKFNIHADHFLKEIDGVLWVFDSNEISAGSHSYFSDDKVRQATDVDIAAITIYKELEKMKWN